MKQATLFRWSSRFAAMTLSLALASAIPVISGASSFEGNSGYIAMLLIPPTLIVVWLAMRAWNKKLTEGTKTYRITFATYCVLSIPFFLFVAAVLI